ncbi:MAG: LysM peptidoglycan-binding domain-containing protein [Anaerohalosphaeraceae bacterium]
MTSDGKIGLLISFLFIVIIAFLINGPGGFFKADKPVIETAVQVPSSRSVLIEQAVEQAARELEPAPLRQTQPPADIRLIEPTPATPATAPAAPAPAVQTQPAAPAAPSASAAPTPATTPTPPAGQIHTVQKGDTLASIAVRYYGKETGNTRAAIQKLYEANRNLLTSPDSIRIGDKLVIPPLEKAAAGSAQASPSRPERVLLDKYKNVLEPAVSDRNKPRTVEYVVQPGDRLWDIAQKYLGDGKRYQEIVQLNQAQIPNPDNLQAGTRLKIPVR